MVVLRRAGTAQEARAGLRPLQPPLGEPGSVSSPLVAHLAANLLIPLTCAADAQSVTRGRSSGAWKVRVPEPYQLARRGPAVLRLHASRPPCRRLFHGDA